MADHLNPNQLSDSAGVPWEGRSFDANPFASDDGGAPKELIEAIQKFRGGDGAAEAVVDAIRVSRLLVPLLAKLGESEIGPNGLVVDKSAELSIVTVKAPDEQDALVVFSSVEAMGRWNRLARPVPTDAIRVALAAASEGSTRVVLDPGSDTEFVLRRVAIAKIAQSLPWVPPERNERVAEIVEGSISEEPAVSGFELVSGDPESRLRGAELEVRLRLRSGLSAETVSELVDRITKKWAVSESFAESVDSVSIRLLAD